MVGDSSSSCLVCCSGASCWFVVVVPAVGLVDCGCNGCWLTVLVAFCLAVLWQQWLPVVKVAPVLLVCCGSCFGCFFVVAVWLIVAAVVWLVAEVKFLGWLLWLKIFGLALMADFWLFASAVAVWFGCCSRCLVCEFGSKFFVCCGAGCLVVCGCRCLVVCCGRSVQLIVVPLFGWWLQQLMFFGFGSSRSWLIVAVANHG